MLEEDAQNEKRLTFFPDEYKQYLPELTTTEINLIENALLDETNFLDIDYIVFCKKTLEVTLQNLGKYPNLERLAANIAFDIRKLDSLDKIAQMSNNPQVFFPLIKGMISRNSLNRAKANIRIIESKIQHDEIENQIELFIVKSML